MTSRSSSRTHARAAALPMGRIFLETLLELVSLAFLAVCLVGLALLRRRG